MNNPIVSEQYVAKILISLYEHWAQPTVLHAQFITGVQFDPELMFEGRCAPSEWRLFEGVVNWLREEQFIRVEGYGAHVYEFHGVILTMKALEVMKKVPDPISKENRSLIDGLKAAMNEGKSSAIQVLVNATMSSLYKSLTGSA